MRVKVAKMLCYFRDAFIVCIVNSLTSVFAGFVIMFYTGFLAKETDRAVYYFADGGLPVAFEMFPIAFTKPQLSPFWAILFFLMLIAISLNTQVVLVETVATSLTDRFVQLRKYKWLTVLVLCFSLFLLGLTLTTKVRCRKWVHNSSSQGKHL